AFAPGRVGPRAGDHGRGHVAAVHVQRPARDGAPAVDGTVRLARQPGPDAQQRPAPGPRALPRGLLALRVVALLEAEPAPRDVEARVVAHGPQPQAGLVGPRAHE